jgi:murein L,D-transpeptidase YcbB/YkuD
MRKGRFGLFAGSVLAVTAAAPTLSVSAPDRVESVLPPPPMLNGHRTIRRHAAPTPPPPAPAIRHRVTIHRDPPPVHAAVPVPQHAPTPLAKAQHPTEKNGIGFKGALNKVMAASDAQTGEKLRAIVTSKALAKWIDRAPDRKDVAAFYAARDYAPIWIQDGAFTERSKSVIARLKDASTEGLDAADYPVPDLSMGSSAEAEAQADLELTASVLDFARHLSVGRIAPTRVTAQVQYGNHTPDPGDILKKISLAHDINAAFDSFDPPDRGFRALKAKLAVLRAQSGDAAPNNRIPDGPAIRPGAKDSRIPLLRARLGLRSRQPNDPTYRRALYNAIRRLQHEANLKPNGIIDHRTLALLNGPTHAQVIDTVLANMERWRWLPRDLGRSYVMVNIPDYTLKVVHDGRVVWRTKIVAGKPQTPTPLLTASMDQVIVNPSWYVPQSIIQNELLPAYQTDPNIFDRLGLEVKRGPDGHINVVQPPGAANALGRIKFNFPNKFQVYLHDTPEKRLFSYSKRAFSHGCMRVEDPTKVGEVILSLAMSGPAPNARQIRSLFGQAERKFRLTNRPMVHLTYQTAFVDDAGKLQLRDDIYGFDARIHAILTTDERRVADIAPPPDPKRDLDTERSNQEILSRVERREAGNPFAFFESLFRR